MESAVREGLALRPWEALLEQVVLGGAEFPPGLMRHVGGDAQEQRGARRLMAERPGLHSKVGAVEEVKGEKGEEFRERHGDTGRNFVLYLWRGAAR